VGPTAASTCLAACCGVSGCFGTAWSAACAGRVNLVTLFRVLCHSHAVRPSLITSLSLSDWGTASRKCPGLAYHTPTGGDPVSSDDGDVGCRVGGSGGRPNEAVSTTVPVSGGVVESAPSASSWAAVRGGSPGAAWAAEISDPASPPPVMTSAPAGMTHRDR